jgi:hypothetical protein
MYGEFYGKFYPCIISTRRQESLEAWRKKNIFFARDFIKTNEELPGTVSGYPTLVLD